MERQSLKNQSEALQAELNAIRRRLSEIETGTAAA
jgi:prefoldin subunit 5